MAQAILKVRQSTEDDRPDLVTKRKPGLDEDSRVNYGLVKGTRQDVESWTPWELYCSKRGRSPVSEWDCFMLTHTSGLFSERAIDALAAYLDPCFVPLPALLDGLPYYFLHCASTIDCLDMNQSEIDYFPPPDDDAIMYIRRWRFEKGKASDPSMFAVPQNPLQLLATESIPDIAHRANLRGFNFVLLDGPNST